MKRRRKRGVIFKIFILILASTVFINYSDRILNIFPENIEAIEPETYIPLINEKAELQEEYEYNEKEENNERNEFDVIKFFFKESPSMYIENISEPAHTIENISVDIQDTEIDYEKLINNDTTYNIDVQKLLKKDISICDKSENFTILIVHTHGSEAYTPDQNNYFIPDDIDRTTDKKYNVLRVGDELEKILTDAGINVIHDESLHDYPSYSGSYSRSLDTIKSYISKDPSISMVIDLHRDAFISDDGTRFKTFTEINGTPSAQLMLVMGTDEGGLNHPHWRDNLAFALDIQTHANEVYPDLMRPIHLRSERFNQHCTTGSILLEVGSSGNTLDEALTAVTFFADILISVLKK